MRGSLRHRIAASRPRSLVSTALVGLILLVAAPSVRAAYTVWTCYGGTWWPQATTPNYSQAVNYANAFRSQYGYATQITTGARPTQSCGTPAQQCFYYAVVSYYGRRGYLGGYLTQAEAVNAGQAYVRAYGRAAAYHGTFRECR